MFQGASPFNDGTTIRMMDRPEQGFAIPQAPERLEEFAPGLTPELMELMQAAARLATTGATVSGSGVTVGGALGTTATPAQEATTVTERVRVQDQTGRVHDVTNRTDGQ